MSKESRIVNQKLWCAIRVFKDFSIPKIAEICKVDGNSAQKFVFMLRRHDYVTWQEGDKDHTLFRLIRDTGGLAPSHTAEGLKDPNMAGLVGDVSQRLWNAICQLNSWEAIELASLAFAVKGTASRYTRLLVSAEYARCEPRNTRVVGTRNRYQLTKKTGAIAPLFLDDGRVFDSNLFLQELWALKSSKKRKVKA